MSTSTPTKKDDIKNRMKSIDLELSILVGREMLVLSDRFKNNSIYTKVVMVHENIISLDRGGEGNEINNVESELDVVVQFAYKGQRLSAKAKLSQTSSGRSNVVLQETVIPLNRRMFKRYYHKCQVRCAILPILRIIESDMSKLRWLEVESLNISSGGILLPIPSKITENTYLLLNIGFENQYLPNLIIGQMRHTQMINNYNYHVGVQFILKEEKENFFSPLTIKKIPPKALDYTIKNRNLFDKFLYENMSKREE